jgi:hypothetical protein
MTNAPLRAARGRPQPLEAAPAGVATGSSSAFALDEKQKPGWALAGCLAGLTQTCKPQDRTYISWLELA